MTEALISTQIKLNFAKINIIPDKQCSTVGLFTLRDARSRRRIDAKICKAVVCSIHVPIGVLYGQMLETAVRTNTAYYKRVVNNYGFIIKNTYMTEILLHVTLSNQSNLLSIIKKKCKYQMVGRRVPISIAKCPWATP